MWINIALSSVLIIVKPKAKKKKAPNNHRLIVKFNTDTCIKTKKSGIGFRRNLIKLKKMILHTRFLLKRH